MEQQTLTSVHMGCSICTRRISQLSQHAGPMKSFLSPLFLQTDAKSPIMHIFASFQDIVSKEDLLHLLMHIDTREALLFCFLLFCFIGFVFYFFSQKTFLSKAESSR